MAHILIMPRQGNTVESCIIVNWKVNEGDQVTDETTICEVETDKAAFEIPAGTTGKVLKILFNAGDDVPVLEPIAIIGDENEDWQEALLKESGAKKENISDCQNTQISNNTPVYQSPVSSPSSTTPDSSISPRARHLTEKESLSVDVISTQVEGTGPEGRIIERDVFAVLEQKPLLTAAAKAHGADVIPQQGTGLNGRVTLKDISSHVSDPKSLPIKGIRKIIADRMIKSLAETAQYTLNASAPVSKLQNLRHRLNVNLSDESKSASISVNDLILFAVSRVLPDFTFMNAHKIGDNLSIIEEIHLGMAVDTPRGLMVPVIRHANLLSLPEISLESKRLSAACKNGNIKTFELTGSTFTVTNLGRFGITSFTPILNTPEVAILGVCGIEMKPVPHTEINKCTCGCSMNFEPQIGFSLTINHQAVDGAPAARFLKALCDTAAKIDSLVTEN